MKRILVMYLELAGYFVECLNHLCDQYDVEAHVIAYPVNTDAPFQFRFSDRVKIDQREDHTRESLMKMVVHGEFDLIFSGGWSDTDYLAAIKHRRCKALLGFDNQWNGSLRHVLSALYGRYRIKPLFEYAFVPGSLQKQFALHLGFANTTIITGAYACDVQKFSQLQTIRNGRVPRTHKKLMYTGRYAEEKFIGTLWDVISEMTDTELNQWTLHCAGTGPMWKDRLQNERIVHHGFLQPDELFEIMKDGDAFILPSTFEPWGVVVHEFASAGYPLLVSSAVGSSESFLQDGENGYLLKPGDKANLRENLLKLFSSNEDMLKKMGYRSAELSHTITPDTWAQSLYSIM
jgi:glycosyltransferase involved in cell wall biosynthesis